MIIIFLFTTFLLTVNVQALSLTGHTGGAVIMKCGGYDVHRYINNRKYLCKASGPVCSTNIIVDNGGTPAQDKRFSLHDYKMEGNFMVLITQLTPADSGTYKCVVENTTISRPADTTLTVKTGPWQSTTISRLLEESFKFICAFPEANKERKKYVCHHQRKLTCFELNTSEERRQIHMLPNGSVSVTLDQLTAEDAGEYWCGVQAAVGESITLISRTQLMIASSSTTSSWSTSTSSSTTSSWSTSSPSVLPTVPGLTFLGKSVVVQAGLTAVALLLVIIVIICRKQRTREHSHPSDGPSNITDKNNQISVTAHVYDEIIDTSQTRPIPNSVYALAQLPTILPNDPTYLTAWLPTNRQR
ncbi:CMRF35-like molecule 1 isoform X2 [Alosa sapidissima]|uniref:CMRF35-like molecule 1 isoform X2 n=1 Tax=Alosa sapidissima TaxID=34773 RepID=UPI001C091E36|nr:CMRF35-like molecule 1 isoform X2 [Alosa sapidissima]